MEHLVRIILTSKLYNVHMTKMQLNQSIKNSIKTKCWRFQNTGGFNTGGFKILEVSILEVSNAIGMKRNLF